MATLSTTEIQAAASALREIAGDPSHPLEAAAWVATNGVFICPIQGDVTTDLATSQKFHMRAPFAFTVTDLKASLHTASSSGAPTFDVNKNGTTIISTKLTVDATEKTSATAAAAYAFSATAADRAFAADDEVSIDVDVAGAAGTKGAVVYVYYQRTA
jgi:hypothetical protein